MGKGKKCRFYPGLVSLVIAAMILGSGLAQTRADNETNVALAANGATVIASDVFTNRPNNGPGNLIDGILSRGRWHVDLGTPHPHWVFIKFAGMKTINKVVIYTTGPGDYPVAYKIQYTKDNGKTWITLFSEFHNIINREKTSMTIPLKPATTNNIRFLILESSRKDRPNYAQLREIEVFGHSVSP